MHDEIIRVNALTKDYGEGKGIFGLDFAAYKGEVFGIVGTNGSGKTTTLRHLCGFLKPDSGSCEIKGLDCRKKCEKIMAFTGYVPGEIDFPDVGSGTDFLKIQAQFMGIKDLSYAARLSDMFGLDTEAPLKRMSKGMKQKTALVAAFMSRPDVLLLDEPSTGLDPLMRDTLIELINEEKKRGAAIIMSSHIFKELDDTADRVLFIDKGRQTELADVSSLTADRPKLYRAGFRSIDDMLSFEDKASFKIDHDSREHLHADILVGENDTGMLFAELSDYDVRYLRYREYSLEDHYLEITTKGGIKSA